MRFLLLWDGYFDFGVCLIALVFFGFGVLGLLFVVLSVDWSV